MQGNEKEKGNLYFILNYNYFLKRHNQHRIQHNFLNLTIRLGDVTLVPQSMLIFVWILHWKMAVIKTQHTKIKLELSFLHLLVFRVLGMGEGVAVQAARGKKL